MNVEDLPPGFSHAQFIRAGGWAQVFRCVDDASGREVALKLFLHPLDDPTADADAFRRECRVAARLSAHPGVVTLHAAGITASGRPWLTMDLANGTLADRIQQGGPLPVQRALDLTVALADTLAWAHALPSPVVHGDLKPSNVLLDGAGRPLLSDFGGATQLENRHSVTIGQFTQPYAAPEVLADGRASISSDVWSLCATMFEMLTGIAPFAARTGEGLGGFIDRVRAGLTADAIPASVPAPVTAVVLAGMAVDRTQRTGSMVELGARLRAAQQALGYPVTPQVMVPVDPREPDVPFTSYAESVALTTARPLRLVAAGEIPPPPKRRRRTLVVASIAAVLALLLTGAGIAVAASGVGRPSALPPPGTGTPGLTASSGDDGSPAARGTSASTPGAGVVTTATTIVVNPRGGGSGSTTGSGHTPPKPSSTSAAPAPTYPPITGLNITTSANETTVNFTVSVDPNGKSATVHVTTNQQTQIFTTGTTVWTWSNSDNVGYNATDYINVSVTDSPDRATVSGSASQHTPCAVKNNNGQWPTFSGNGGSWTVPGFSAGQEVTYNLPGPVKSHLDSITGNGAGAFHIVTYGGDNQTGNLAHWDGNVSSGQLPNTPGYYQTASVKVYFNRQC